MATNSNFFTSDIGGSNFLLQHNVEQQDKIMSAYTKKRLEDIEKARQAEAAAIAEIERLKQSGTAKDLAMIAEVEAARDAAVKNRKTQEAELAEYKKGLEEQVNRAAQLYEENRFKKMSAAEKRAYSKAASERLKEELATSKALLDANKKRIEEINELKKDSNLEPEDLKKLEEELNRLENSNIETRQKIAEFSRNKKTADSNAAKFDKWDFLSGKEKRAAALKNLQDSKREKTAEAVENRKLAKEKLKGPKELLDLEKKIKNTKDKNLRDQLKAELKAEQAKWEASKEYQQAEKELKKANLEEFKAQSQEALANTAEKANKLANASKDAINQNIEAMYGQQGRMIARLQGANLDWKEAVSEISDTIGVSGMVSKKSVIAKMVELVDSGVAYNLEMRAFLAETSENIASTFDATNGTLLRLIRLQQADTTTARLGMEATLNKFLNSMFKDTSYLAENISENVTAAILDASMTMNKNASLEFEYVLQKWMGALYSLGMSAEGVQNIATAINYLGTGNVSALNNNEAMQTLLAMSATKAGGKSYADMLTQGINASDTNRLLKAMIEYLAEIASTQDNMVTKSAFSEIFGMNITDLSSFTSLTKGDISSIYSQNVTYDSLTKETEKQLKEIPKRLNLTQLVTNVVDNAMVGAADVIGSNIVTYGTWQALKLLTDNVDEVKVPVIPNLDLINVAELVMAGMSLVATLVGALGGIGKNPTSLSNWKFDEYNRKGGGLALLDSGSSSNTSFSSNLAVAGSGSDFEAVTMQEASNKKSEFEGVTSEDWEEENKVYNALDEGGETIIQVVKDIRALLGGGGRSGGGASNGNSTSRSPNSALPGDSSSPYETAVGNNGSMLTAEGASTKIYELLEKSLIDGHETLITVIQSLSDKLDEQLGEQRVFYTSIISESSAPSDTSNKVSDLSSQVAVNGATNKPSTDASVTSTPTTGTSVSTGNGQKVSGSSMTTNASNPAELQEVITAAVEAAIRLVSGYDGNSGIPVYVTNLHTYGG